LENVPFSTVGANGNCCTWNRFVQFENVVFRAGLLDWKMLALGQVCAIRKFCTLDGLAQFENVPFSTVGAQFQTMLVLGQVGARNE